MAASPSNQIAKHLAGAYFKIDANADGQIQQSEALNVKYLDASRDYMFGFDTIYSLEGIIQFTNLETLYCFHNSLNVLNLVGMSNLKDFNCVDSQVNVLLVNGLTNLLVLNCGANSIQNLNLNDNLNLQTLICYDNLLSTINVSSLLNLQTLDCSYNVFTNINLNGLTNLQSLKCKDCQLPNLFLNGLLNLQNLNCEGNQIQSLGLSGLTNLQTLYCSSNPILSLNLNGLTNLHNLGCYQLQITTLDLSQLINLTYFYCHYNNQLTSLFIKNGINETYLDFSNCPNLNYICADDSQISDVQNKIDSYGYTTTCLVNSYCSFSPGGTFYTIQCSNKFDSNSNGCDALDINYPNLKLTFSDGTNSVNLISDESGSYRYDVQAGTHTITPILQNPTYFNVSPTTATVTFPTTTSPFVQDFCITANGVHNDLEITLLPIGPARPGFDAHYKIVYKNKGTQTQSGMVNLTYDDAVLDFVSANPITTNQSLNNLSWSFTNLLPFESREILLTLNANSPTETPPLNSGNILNFTATITAATDETPNDNVSILNQTVVNSFDPNDKTCLEGDNIAPAKVGEYVHYMIRFENTGTFPAQNIVVKDIIDATKFDITTFLPVSGSHDFTTRINGDKVEFIFQNINLPFATGSNDDYVAFKIKTKSTLVLGNAFSNLANIYFDYNFPIVTNTTTTTVANPLATQDFEFATYFSLYPNPVKNSLNITVKNDVIISSMSIYNTLGQLVQVITNPSNNIEVSELKTGNYFVKIVSDKGTSGSKFIKE